MIPPVSCRSRSQGVLGAAVGAVVAGLMFTNSQAQALVVTVNSQDWEVTTFYGSYNDNVSKFETAANGGVMPWWGSSADADAFATAVGSGLGFPNQPAFIIPLGPLFAYDAPAYYLGGFTVVSSAVVERPWGLVTDVVGPLLASWPMHWAQATLVPAGGSANVPGPLPALGLAAAFGFSRQLRKRIKASSNSSSAGA